MGLPGAFGAAANNQDPVELQPINERNVIPLRRNDDFKLNVVNSHYIATTGDIPAFADGKGRNYHIDWQHPDSFTNAVNTAANATVRDLQTDRDVQRLLQKPSWTKQDREFWEQKEATYAAQERAKVGLGDYRTINIPGGPLADKKNIQQNAIDITNLNDLSKDLDNGTKNYRNDCGVMAAVDAVVLDRAEQLLPKTAGAHDYKRASAYYYTDGGVSGQGFGLTDKIGGHAFLISSATGNVIEATATSPGSVAYQRAVNGNSLEQYVKGRPIVTQDGTVYGAWSNINDHNVARNVAEMQRTHATDDGKIFNRTELMARDRANGNSVIESPGNGLLMVATKGTEQGQDKYEVKVFERQNVGTAQEGYVLVGQNAKLQAPGSTPPTMSVSFKEQDGQFKGNYRFDASFGDKDVKSDIVKERTLSNGQKKLDVLAEKDADYAKFAVTPTPVPPAKIEPAKVVPPSERYTPPKTGSSYSESYGPPPQRVVPTGGGNGFVPGQPPMNLPPGAVDLTDMTRVNRYGARPVTLYDWQGHRSSVLLDPQALSGVVQVSRDPRITNNILLTVTGRDGQNRMFSMSPQDAANSLAGYGSAANPAFQQIRGINAEIMSEQYRQRGGWHVPSAPVERQPTYDPNGRSSDFSDRAPRSYRDFPTAPRMGREFAMESRGMGGYAMRMAERDAMIMAQREAIMANSGRFGPRERGVSVNIGVRLGR